MRNSSRGSAWTSSRRGSPSVRPGDFEAIKRIGAEVEGPIICSLARAKKEDIDRAWEALKDAPKRRIHTFHSTSDIHLKHQYRISREEALKRAAGNMISDAANFALEFDGFDFGTRSTLDFVPGARSGPIYGAAFPPATVECQLYSLC